ncbi:MAG: 4-(cytidine 5'-diphospho)-2-C-methyl-D-erythritol kinase [Rhizobiales bacterium]|nr:4-(cytidine 5'-diphospho)-2-C-methyl-D-erythritol kinase [Hyphomicrobiales bacterium]
MTGNALTLEERAPAKVNLFLEVHGRRPGDGYHLLESLVVFARDACDIVRLTVQGAGIAGRDTNSGDPNSSTLRPTHLEGPMAGALEGPNIVDAAVALVRHEAGRVGQPLSGIAVTLDKRLPVAAGIGGGSADAAATLRLISRAFPELEPRLDWPALALQLGADVPVCLAGRAAVMTGIGERLTPLRLAGGLHGVLVNPRVGVATRSVFARLAARMLEPDEVARASEPGTLGDLARLGPGAGAAIPPAALVDWLITRRNHLEAPALQLVPAMAVVRDALDGLAGRRLVRMSGSGATWFALFEDAQAAASGARELAAAHPDWWVAASRLS